MKASKPPRVSLKPETDAGMPVSVRFTATYGFVDDYGDRWHWDFGEVVRNPFVIDMLTGRAAPITVVDTNSLPTEKIEE